MRIRFGALWRQSDFVNLWAAQSVTQVGTQISMLAIPLIAAITLDAAPLPSGCLPRPARRRHWCLASSRERGSTGFVVVQS
jgi:hypothetical protein